MMPRSRRAILLTVHLGLASAISACTLPPEADEAGASGRSGRSSVSPRLEVPSCLQPVQRSAIDRLFTRRIGARDPGAAVAVLHRGEILHQAGYGLASLTTGEPITSHTPFELASVSKQFSAIATLILAQEGRLALDDPVVRHLPELARFGPRLTIRHLLTHGGGLPDYYDALVAAFPDRRPTNEEAVAFLARWGEPRFAPGDRYEYSNPGYELLAAILARAAGEPFREVMQSRIFDPLGMTGSFVRDGSAPAVASRAIGYARADQGWRLADEHPLNHLVGSGSLYSTVEDLVRWERALASGELVSPALLEQAFRPHLSDPEQPAYGLGWRVGADARWGRALYHSGSWLGFRAFVARYPQAGVAVIVLANRADFDASGRAEDVARLYAPTFLIRGANVIDGTGGARRRTEVRVRGDRIAEVAPRLEAGSCEPLVEANGLALAPGFIDSHSHADRHLGEQPAAIAAVSQGITTVVVGQDGDSPYPLAEFAKAVEQEGSAVDVAALVGHGTLRERVMGSDFRRPATPAETAAMAERLEQELAAGALGLSTGLEYDPGIYSTTAELVALARIAAAPGGIYVSHIRSEDRRFWEALEEIVRIGRDADLPVHVSHLKLAMRSSHGETARLRHIFESARDAGVAMTADLYPYTYWQSSLTVFFPQRDFRDRAEAELAVTEISVPEDMLVPRFLPEPALAGKTLAEIATARGTDAAQTLLDLIAQAQAFERATGTDDVERVIATSMAEPDIDTLMRWPWVGFSTDGELLGEHPRGRGSYPRILGRYVRDRGVLSLEQAVHKMTQLPARIYRLAALGRIAPGHRADLVLFDPARVIDRATLERPRALAVGVSRVWVGGELVWDGTRPTGSLPGRFLRREAAASNTGEPVAGLKREPGRVEQTRARGGREPGRHAAGEVPGGDPDTGGPPGYLFLVGGGERSDAMMRRFVELAGGAGRAEVVVLPLASDSSAQTGAETVEEFTALGVRARTLTPSREEAESEDAAALLGNATAVWFTGGDQARVTRVLLGTPLHEAIRALRARGGVIGGTSAGAAVMSDPMLTGNQVRGELGYHGDEFRRIARNYIDLQPGLGYLPGVIVDQHFTARERHNRLLSAVLSHPELLGVGIDEATALIVRPDGLWEVLGESVVSVYDARAAAVEAAPGGLFAARDVRLYVLPPSSRFDPAGGPSQGESTPLAIGGHAHGGPKQRSSSISP
ncbi:MAG: cyanophycinase [Thermoanaerobaculia bacterium]